MLEARLGELEAWLRTVESKPAAVIASQAQSSLAVTQMHCREERPAAAGRKRSPKEKLLVRN